MAFPTGTVIDVTNLSTGSGDPSLARVDLYNMAVALNQIISGADEALGVATLSGTNQYDGSKFPSTITSTYVIAPSTGVVNIQDVLRLTALTSVDIAALTGNQVGDIAVSQDADSGNVAFCMFDGVDWRYVGISSWGTI